jgi:DNA polymerase
MKKFIIVDGNHCVHRIWNTSSGQSLTASDGQPTGVIHGFLASICTLAKKFESTDITVVWDHRSRHRSKLIAEYHQTSGRSEDEVQGAPGFYKESRYADRSDHDHEEFHNKLIPQMESLQYIIPKLGIRQLHIPGVEGDDLIGITAGYLDAVPGDLITIVSSDHDLWQLLNDNTQLYDPIRKKSFTKNDFIAKFGLLPASLPEIRSLSGDPKDDIPGIPRIGEKTAAKWLCEYGGIREIIEIAATAPKNALMSTVPRYIQQIQLAYDLSWILDDAYSLDDDQQSVFFEQWDSNGTPQWEDVQTFTDVYGLKKVWALIQDVFDTDELRHVTTFSELWDKWGDCQRCGLCKTRNKIVRYGGVEKARILLLGEGPGASEDFYGQPFVGKSGKHMRDYYFEPNGLSYEDFHIANIVCCRPTLNGDNRPPTKEEVAACASRLRAQIRLVNPEVVVLIGDKALKAFFPESGKISRERGLVFEHDQWPGIKFVPVFHPSYLGRLKQDRSDVVKSREDWKLIGKLARDY